VGESLPRVTITAKNPVDAADDVARELALCWKDMLKKGDVVKCPIMCYCTTPTCACRTLTAPERYNKPPLVNFGKMRDALKSIELQEYGKPDALEGASDSLTEWWKMTPQFGQHAQFKTGSIDELRELGGIFENVNYLVCADDRWFSDSDYLFVTDHLDFECDQ
jgi:hypothetical protein